MGECFKRELQVCYLKLHSDFYLNTKGGFPLIIFSGQDRKRMGEKSCEHVRFVCLHVSMEKNSVLSGNFCIQLFAGIPEIGKYSIDQKTLKSSGPIRRQ